MLAMFYSLTFLLVAALVLAGPAPAAAQTPPPGAPFDAAKHSNPIITFVETKEFKQTQAEQARKDSGMELLGLSRDEGVLESVAIADGRFVRNMSILGIRTDVTLYPVVRQTFKLTGGANLVLHSFRFPRVSLPRDFTKIVLNEAALEKKKKPSEMRFGGAKPETLEIRGVPGLLFEDGGPITVYWQENGVAHTATATLSRQELFIVIDDLL